MRVLVGGATGYLGRHVVRELHDRGHEVRALGRNPSRLGDLEAMAPDVVLADASKPTDLVGCCDGVGAVVSTIGLMKPSLRTSHRSVDYAANLNLLREAKSAGVQNFVYVSVLQRPGMEKLAIVRAKLAFEEELERSGISYSILRPNGYFSDMDQFLQMARKGRVYVFGTGDFTINPIDGGDVARAAVDAVGSADGGTIELGGPHLLTHRSIAEAAFAALGEQPRVSTVPAWLPRAMVGALRCTTPARIRGAAEFVLTVLTRDLVAPETGGSELRAHFDEQVRHGD